MAQHLILVADDDADVRLVFGTVLRHYGFAVIEAKDGGEVLEQALAHSPDIILLDMLMPVLDGWDAMRALAGEPATAAIPVIAISVSDLRRAELQAAGFCAALTKPLEAAVLVRSVRMCLEGSSGDAGWTELSRLLLPPMG
jgi:CheY-like chemotaxis protein